MTIAELNRPTTSVAVPDPADTTMKALVDHGPGERAWDQKPRPVIEKPTDAVVRITTTTLCGTDLIFGNAAQEGAPKGSNLRWRAQQLEVRTADLSRPWD